MPAHHSTETKLQAVLAVNNGEFTCAEMAKKLQVNPNTISKWRKVYQKRGEQAFHRRSRSALKPKASPRSALVPTNVPAPLVVAAQEAPDPLAEIATLKAENAKLRKERDVLKNALVFFVKDAE